MFKRLFSLVLVAALSATGLFAATGSAPAKARIGAPLIITAGDTLSFGTIFVTNQTSGGTVNVGIDGTGNVTTGDTGGAKILKSGDVNDTNWVLSADDPALGTFTVKGPPTNQLTYVVSVAAPDGLAFDGTCPAGANCNDLVLTPGIVFPDTASGDGETVFKVGGTLAVAGTQHEGPYAGTYNITANYQ